MSKLAQLIPVVADALGLEEKTVSHGARVLRDAGLIATGGRGYGGAEMGNADAANLLIGLLGSDTLLGAPDAVAKFRRLERHGRTHALPAPLAFLATSGITFGEALESLIGAARRGALDGMGAADRRAFRLSLIRPECAALIELEADGVPQLVKFWIPRAEVSAKGVERRHSVGRLGGDRRVSEAVGARTIIAIAELLGPVA
jgi:hypothetical protein